MYIISQRLIKCRETSFITLDEEGPDEMKDPCRKYTLLRSGRNIPRERVDSWKHEDRPGPGCEGLLSFKDVTVWRSWSNLYFETEQFFFGSHRERNQQIRDRNVRRNTCCKRWEQRYRETCREGQATTKADFLTVDSCVYSLSWTKMDRRWSRKIQSRLFWSVKNSWSECYDTMIQFIEKMMEL